MKSSKTYKKCLLLSIPFLFFSLWCVGQNVPVSQSANSMVDLLTGDFKYSLPVMSVPGPNGENVPIVFNYQGGGIRMDAEASWIGLGWDYNPGEITHVVKGVSDDWKYKKVTTTTVATSVATPTTDETYFDGPLYFNSTQYSDPTKTNPSDINTSMDIYNSSYHLPSGNFYYPDYDDYQVSGHGIGGVMQSHLFDFADFHLKSKVGKYVYPDQYKPGYQTFYETHFSKPTEKINFVFKNDINSDGYSSSTNRTYTANYIEYFTNDAINNNYCQGFLDYKIATGANKRPAPDFDPNGIGAIQITTPEGMVYHYSLPVYNLENDKTTSFFTDNLFDPDNNQELNEFKFEGRYVTSWKLTAVTGPDYKDENNNGVADVGDSGYWVSYSYGKWIDNYSWRSPFFNYNQNQFNKHKPTDYRPPIYTLENFNNEGMVTHGQRQMYYLNSIQTATHTAFFIKEIRNDGYDINKAPSLRLSKVVLVRNEDISTFSTSANLTSDSRFDLTNCFIDNIIPHVGNYNANASAIKAISLQTVELVSDYSLCKMVYNNINNSFSTTPITYGSIVLYNKLDPVSGTSSTTDLPNSGKLTLNEVKIFGQAYGTSSPSYLFDYNQSNITKNPNYSSFKTDYWGYYKSDFNFDERGRYTTEGNNGSSNNVDVWSLKKITTPLGGEILIDYESDNYQRLNHNGYYTFPRRYFLVKNATISFPNLSMKILATVDNEINKFINLPSANISQEEFYLPFTGYGTSGTCPKRFNYAYVARGGSSSISLSSGSTSTTQNFVISGNNIVASLYPPCNNEVISYTYIPKLVLDITGNGAFKQQGYGYIDFDLSSASGGGIRVKQITVRDPESNKSYINEYTYELGAAGTDPGDFVISDDHTVVKNINVSDRHSPPPMVTYGKISIRSKSLNGNYNGKTVFEFQNMIEPFEISSKSDDPVQTSIYNVFINSSYTVKETMGLFGSLKSVTNFGNNNNILSSTQYEYVESDKLPSISESFHQVVIIPGVTLYGNSLYIFDKFFKAQCQTRLKKKTTFNDGIITTEETLAWDPITGQPTKTRVIDPTNGITETKNIPAYTIYSGMGARSKDATNGNFLTLPYKTTVSKDKIVRDVYNQLVAGGNIELVSGSKTLWQESFQRRAYDKQTSRYINKTAIVTNFNSWKPQKTFNFNGDADDSNWRQEGEFTLFNNRNNTLETKSIPANRFAASKYGYDDQYLLCQAKDARYEDFTYSSFEDQQTVADGVIHFGGEITEGQMRFDGNAQITPHTGKFVVQLNAGSQPIPTYYAKNFTSGRTYRASVWVHNTSSPLAKISMTLTGKYKNSTVTVNSTVSIAKNDPSNITVGNWTLMTLTIDVPIAYLESSGELKVYLSNTGSNTAYFDDLNFHPVDATFSGFVYDTKTGWLSAEVNNEDFATFYEYDAVGRIINVSKETILGISKVAETEYHFSR